MNKEIPNPSELEKVTKENYKEIASERIKKLFAIIFNQYDINKFDDLKDRLLKNIPNNENFLSSVSRFAFEGEKLIDIPREEKIKLVSENFSKQIDDIKEVYLKIKDGTLFSADSDLSHFAQFFVSGVSGFNELTQVNRIIPERLRELGRQNWILNPGSRDFDFNNKWPQYRTDNNKESDEERAKRFREGMTNYEVIKDYVEYLKIIFDEYYNFFDAIAEGREIK